MFHSHGVARRGTHLYLYVSLSAYFVVKEKQDDQMPTHCSTFLYRGQKKTCSQLCHLALSVKRKLECRKAKRCVCVGV